jgi:hypothetical protein
MLKRIPGLKLQNAEFKSSCRLTASDVLVPVDLDLFLKGNNLSSSPEFGSCQRVLSNDMKLSQFRYKETRSVANL